MNATSTGGIVNIQNVFGGSGNNTLVGSTQNNIFKAGSGKDYLAGGDGADTFIFPTNWGQITLAATGDGIKTFDFSDVTVPLTFTVSSGVNRVVVSRGTTNTIIYLGNNVSLIGGTIRNHFDFLDTGTILGSLDSHSGVGTLDYSAYASARAFLLSHVGSLHGVAGTEASIGSGFDNIDRIIGSAGVDTLRGANIANTWTITGTNAGTLDGVTRLLTFDSIENITGGNASDQFIFETDTRITGAIDGGAGANTLDLSALATPRNIVLTALGNSVGFAGLDAAMGGFTNISNLIGTGVDTLTGAGVDTIWNLIGTNAGNLNNSLAFAGFGTLNGGAANDTFIFADGANITGKINGGGGVNALDYSAYTTSVTVDLIQGTATGTNGVANIQKVTGGHGDDMLIGGNNVTFGFGDIPVTTRLRAAVLEQPSTFRRWRFRCCSTSAQAM